MKNDRTIRILESYPRPRPELPPAYRRVYDQVIVAGRTGDTVVHRAVLWLESWLHRIVAARGGPGAILEIGAGTLNHPPFEPHTATYHVIEPSTVLLDQAEPANRRRVERIYSTIDAVPVGAVYDRILSTAVLEHIPDLPDLVARSALLLSRPGGLFQAAIPSEGGALWWLASMLTTGLVFRYRTGLDYRVLMRHEHVNSAADIQGVVEYFFRDIFVRRMPLPGIQFSFYSYLEARDPDLARCRAWLDSRSVLP